MSYKPMSRLRCQGSVSVVLDCTDLSLDGLVGSFDAAVGVVDPSWALFAHDFGSDVRAGFVFDVDDARFLIALSLSDVPWTTRCGRVLFLRNHDSCFCKVSTIAKNAFVSPSKSCQDGDWFSILTHKHVGELRHAARTRLLVRAFLAPGTHKVSAPVSEGQVRQFVLFNF